MIMYIGSSTTQENFNEILRRNINKKITFLSIVENECITYVPRIDGLHKLICSKCNKLKRIYSSKSIKRLILDRCPVLEETDIGHMPNLTRVTGAKTNFFKNNKYYYKLRLLKKHLPIERLGGFTDDFMRLLEKY